MADHYVSKDPVIYRVKPCFLKCLHDEPLRHSLPGAFLLRFFIGLRTNLFLLSYLPLLRSISLIIRRLHRTASSFFLIPYHPDLRLSLVLSSGALLISLSVVVLLSCMIHRLTKQWYCRPWTMSPSPPHFICSSPLAVYKLYYYSTWTLSLSFRAIETPEA